MYSSTEAMWPREGTLQPGAFTGHLFSVLFLLLLLFSAAIFAEINSTLELRTSKYTNMYIKHTYIANMHIFRHTCSHNSL